MDKIAEPKWPKDKDHLNKTFLEELGHKLWNTKGTRFVASERLITRNDLSNRAIGFMSAYLIIYGLFSVYQISGPVVLDNKVIAFSSTTLAILLLVFTQLESAQDYKLRAYSFHKCALEISRLHDKLRLFKTLISPTDEEKIEFCQNLSEEYQGILMAYPNHNEIDYEFFRARHKDYYQMTGWQVAKIRVRYYLKTRFIYHVLIWCPLVLLIMILWL